MVAGGKKRVARAAFDSAYKREREAIRRRTEEMLQDARDHRVIWRIEEYLDDRRRETDQKYDYRYSVLPFVFARLLAEGWLDEEKWAGFAVDQLEMIKRVARI